MSINLSTQVKNIRARMSEVADSREATEQEFMRFAELRNWYRSAILSEAIVAVYGDAYPSVEQLLAGWKASGTRLERAEKLAAEAWQLILQRAGIDERTSNFATNTARTVAFTTPKLNAAIKNEAGVWTHEGTAAAPYRGDLFSALVEVVARGLTTALVNGTEAVISGRFQRYPILDLPLISDFVKYLYVLPEAAKLAEREELGVDSVTLRKKAGTEMDTLRFGELGAERAKWEKEIGHTNVPRNEREEVRRLAVLEREPVLDAKQVAERDRLRSKVGGFLAVRDADVFGDDDIATQDSTAVQGIANALDPWSKVATLLVVRNSEEAQVAIAAALGLSADGVKSMTGKNLTQPADEDATETVRLRRRVEHAVKKLREDASLMPQIREMLSDFAGV